ncbi:MAG: fatty acid--CoA ligase family protein [Mycobacterium sp.]
MTDTFTATLAAGIAGYGSRPCIEFEHRWYTGDDITAYIDGIARLLDVAGVPDDAAVGLVVRNRLPHAAAIVGLIAAGRPLAMIYSFQSPESIARDVEQLDLAAVIADADDWTQPVIDAARRAGSAGVALSPSGVTAVTGLEHASGAHANLPAGLHILTSGTTGPPKRVPIPVNVLAHMVISVHGARTVTPQDPPGLAYWPFGNIGVCQLIAAVYVGSRIVLLEKFSVDEFVRAVKTHGIAGAGVQPAVIRMLLDADLSPADLASLDYLISASGPLEPDTREAFEAKYGIPILPAYGATEFAGSVCAWTPELYREHGRTKRDSVGPPLPGIGVRIVDAETGAEVPTGTQGLLEAHNPLIGPDWIRTTDLASVDADGFVTLHGRGDGAINRGGFKILPETVRRVLLSHPAVRDASVVGVPDARLGEVPFAVVEIIPGAAAPSEAELQDLVRAALPRHHIPVAITAIDELPRNPSLKVSLREVKALYQNPPRSADIQR